jgi:hypothetical protein
MDLWACQRSERVRFSGERKRDLAGEARTARDMCKSCTLLLAGVFFTPLHGHCSYIYARLKVAVRGMTGLGPDAQRS